MTEQAPPDRPRQGASQVNAAYYGETSPGRDDYWHKMAAPRHRLAVLCGELTLDQPAAIVDLGCGNGALLREVARRMPAARLAGIDLSAPQIDANRASAPDIAWHAANLEQPVSWPDELSAGFDAVVASEIIEHVDHPRAFLDNARRLARPHGRLYLSTQSGPIRDTEQRVGHRRHYRASEMAALLRRAGWRPHRVWNTGFPFHDLSKWYANRDPDASMARFGDRAYGWREDAICLALRVAFRFNSSRRGAQLFAVAQAD